MEVATTFCAGSNREGNFDLDSDCVCFRLLLLFTFPLMGMDKCKIIIYILGFHFKVKRGLEMIHPDDGGMKHTTFHSQRFSGP